MYGGYGRIGWYRRNNQAGLPFVVHIEYGRVPIGEEGDSVWRIQSIPAHREPIHPMCDCCRLHLPFGTISGLWMRQPVMS